MSLTLEEAGMGNGATFLPCTGCGTWHMTKCMKVSGARLWCVLCFPGGVT